MAWFPGIPVNAIWKYWQMPMKPMIKAVKITDLVKNKMLALLRPRIRQATYKNMNDNNTIYYPTVILIFYGILPVHYTYKTSLIPD